MPRRFFEVHLTQEEIDRGKGILRRRVMENNYKEWLMMLLALGDRISLLRSSSLWLVLRNRNSTVRILLGRSVILSLQGKIPEGTPQIFIFLKRHLVGHYFHDSHFFCGVSGLSFMAYRNKWIKLVPLVIIY
jgi:hypothetical protein